MICAKWTIIVSIRVVEFDVWMRALVVVVVLAMYGNVVKEEVFVSR